MAKIYTKTGDKGETSLLSGERVLKSHVRVELYGEVDEFNSSLGLFLSLSREYNYKTKEIDFLSNLQHVLFDIGALLSCERKVSVQFNLREIDPKVISEMESLIDEMEKGLKPLKNFILPGGHILASHAHLLRTKVRKMEIHLVDFLSQGKEIPNYYLEFLNRLSDFFFVFSRSINKFFSEDEILWR